MKIELDIEPSLAVKPLALRERLAIYILLIIFRMIVPAKYPHQVRETLEPLNELLKP